MKDLVDIVAIAAVDRVQADALVRSVEATFSTRATHAVPQAFPDPPASWELPYARLAGESSTAPTKDLGEATLRARAFWNPLLSGEAAGLTWDAAERAWL